MHATDFKFRLADGAMATVGVSVSLADEPPVGAEVRAFRERDLANFLGGYLAGASHKLLNGDLTEARSTAQRRD